MTDFDRPYRPLRTTGTNRDVLFRENLIAALVAAACFLFLAAASPQVLAADPPTSITLRAIDDPATVAVLESVQRRVEKIRGLKATVPIPSYYFDSETLRNLLIAHVEKNFPESDRRATEAFLKSLRAVPENLDLLDMYLALLGEQVAGLYDNEGKKLYVRRDFDIARSEMAQMILAHEICHALQDQAFDLESLGVDDRENDDRGLAGLSVAEGDAMRLMSEYAARHGSPELLKEIPQVMFADQGALDAAPHLFQQILVFPYLQGQVFIGEISAVQKGEPNAVFRNPPRTTEQIIHPEKYLADRDDPSSLTLLKPPGADWALPARPAVPDPPPGFRRAYVNRLGEAALRALLEEPLGVGIAHDAAEGWDGDAYAVWTDGAGRWWFCLETAWDSDRDARQFLGAWVTLWRTITGEKQAGSLSQDEQVFRAGPWRVALERATNRVVSTWGKAAAPNERP